MTISPDLLPAVDQTRNALQSFYARMAREYGGCRRPAAEVICDPSSQVRGKLEAAFMRNGGRGKIREFIVQGHLIAVLGILENLEIAVNVNLYWLDLFAKGKATLAFEDQNLGLDTLKAFDEELRKRIDSATDMTARSEVASMQLTELSASSTANDGGASADVQRQQYNLRYDSEHYLGSASQLLYTTAGFAMSLLWKYDPPAPRPRVWLFAVTAQGLQYVEEVYLGVAMVAEVTFEVPTSLKEYSLVITVGDRKLKLTAHVVDSKGRIFRTDPFIPTEAKADVGPIFDPPQPQNPDRRQP